MTDLLACVALSLLPPWTGLFAGERLRCGDAPAAVLEALIARHWRDEPDKRASLVERADAAIERAKRGGITAVPWSDPAYPAALAAIVDPPPLLWVRGCVAALSEPAVAIVGARAGSAYALSVAERLAADLAAAGLVVVSGLARGVDSAAHRGTVSASGTTVAILGSGVDVIYPREHERLVKDIEQHGAIVSELVPGTPPQPMFFPRRNRIISGLSRAVVVIEAGEKSGSLITARCALEQGRDVLAVPGNVLNGRNRGAHALLRDGARIVESAEDVLDELGMARSGGSRRSGGTSGSDRSSASGGLDPILESLSVGEPVDLDEIAERSGLNPSRLLPRLFELELQGRVTRVGGGRFLRVDTSC